MLLLAPSRQAMPHLAASRRQSSLHVTLPQVSMWTWLHGPRQTLNMETVPVQCTEYRVRRTEEHSQTRAEQMLLTGGKLQHPTMTRESCVDDKPSGNHHHSRQGPTNQSYSAFAFCFAAGYQAIVQSTAPGLFGRSAWSPRWPTARAPAAARLPATTR